MRVFRVITNNFLNITKRNFYSFEKAAEHINSIIKKRPSWITDEDVANSYFVQTFETNNFPEGYFEKIFPEMDDGKEPMLPSIREMKDRGII